MGYLIVLVLPEDLVEVVGLYPGTLQLAAVAGIQVVVVVDIAKVRTHVAAETTKAVEEEDP